MADADARRTQLLEGWKLLKDYHHLDWDIKGVKSPIRRSHRSLIRRNHR